VIIIVFKISVQKSNQIVNYSETKQSKYSEFVSMETPHFRRHH
jgi:hypothetical protein